MKMKKIALIILSITMIASSMCINVYAEESAPVSSETVQREKILMTVDEAVEYGLKNSPTLKAQIADVGLKQYNKTKSVKSYDKMKKMGYEYQNLEDGLLIEKGYYIELAKSQYESAQRQLNITKINVKNDILSKIYNYKIGVLKTDYYNNYLEYLSEKLEYVKKQYDMGLVSQLDYEQFEVAVKSAEYDLDNARRYENTAMWDVMYVINFDQDKDLVLLGEASELFSDWNFEFPDADEAIKLSRNTDTYLNIMENLRIAKVRYDFAEKYYYPKNYDYYIEKYTYEKTEASCLDNVNKLDSGIRNQYYLVMNYKNATEKAKANIEYDDKKTEAAFTKYQLGMITANEYLSTLHNNNLQKINYLDSMLYYRNNYLTYRAMYTSEDI